MSPNVWSISRVRSQSAEVSVERLRTFLAEAENVNDVAKLERELTNRERDLEKLRGQLTTIEGRVALATILVSFSEAIETPKVRPRHDCVRCP